jgi:hypothetical protein
MRILFALLVGFILAFALLIVSPLLREQVHRARRRLMFWRLTYLAGRLQATMAVPADTSVRGTALPNSDVIALVAEHNNVVATLRLLTAKMDLDAGITDANWNALLTDSAVATAPKKVVPSF